MRMSSKLRESQDIETKDGALMNLNRKHNDVDG